MPSLTVAAQPSNLKKLRAFVQKGAQRAGFGRRGIYAVQLAVDEAASNIIEHGYSGQPGDITCEWRIIPQGLEIVLCDRGRPFDPSQAPPPDLTSTLQQRQTGGLGIYLIQRMVDELHYERTPAGNRLTLVKYREA